MTNSDVILKINSIGKFTEDEQKSGVPFLSISGQFALKYNLNKLVELYKIYADIKNSIDSLEDKTEKDSKLHELLMTDAGELEFKRIKESDFKEGCMFSDIVLLEFMTEEG